MEGHALVKAGHGEVVISNGEINHDIRSPWMKIVLLLCRIIAVGTCAVVRDGCQVGWRAAAVLRQGFQDDSHAI